jgi:hypothetical protein
VDCIHKFCKKIPTIERIILSRVEQKRVTRSKPKKPIKDYTTRAKAGSILDI